MPPPELPPPLLPSPPPPVPEQQLVFNAPLLLPLSLSQPNATVDPFARLVSLKLMQVAAPAGTYLCEFLPASAPPPGLGYMNLTEANSFGSRLWYALPPGFTALLAPVNSSPYIFLLLITGGGSSGGSRFVVQQRCTLTAAYRAAAGEEQGNATSAATALLPGGAYTSTYTADAASSWGALVYCHVLYGGGLGGRDAVSALLLPDPAVRPLLTNTSFFGPALPQTTSPPCCGNETAPTATCDPLSFLGPLPLYDAGGGGQQLNTTSASRARCRACGRERPPPAPTLPPAAPAR
eukprot:XP_001698688.1 predicted protein [Chlamydomonas reinhardtii]